MEAQVLNPHCELGEHGQSRGGKCTSLLVLVPLPVSALMNAVVLTRCRPASDPDRCDRRGETVGERGHRRGRDPPQSAERRLAAVAAQGRKTLS